MELWLRKEKMKILITPRGFANVGKVYVQKLQNAGFEVDYNQTGLEYTPDQLKKKIVDADGIIVGVDKINKKLLDSAPKLKVICKFGVGIDNIDLNEAKRRRIKVGRTIGSNSNSVAEHVLSFIFADAKNLFTTFKDVKEGSWNKLTGREVESKVLGIAGFGAIGKILAQKASSIGMKVIVNDVFTIDQERQKAFGIKEVSFDELLSKSDYLSLHIPLNDQTKNIIGSKELKKMKSDACLINAARGGIVDEDELLLALKNHQIRCAYFDVFSTEPPKKGNKLLAQSNFYLTPHTAARTKEAELRTCEYSTNFILKELKEK